MGTAYTPGLTVNGRARIEKTRRLPLRGEVLVSAGQRVEPGTVLARAELPGEAVLLRAGDKLGLTGDELVALLQVAVGDEVTEGQLLAETPGLMGRWFKQKLLSPVTGTVEAITARTGNIALRRPPRPVELQAYLAGVVTEILPHEGAVVEAAGAFIQGIFGVGPERQGTLALADQAAPGAVVILPGQVTRAAYDEAAEHGAAAVVAGSILDADLRAILGHDIGVAITGEEAVPATLILTEGFGDVPMADRTWSLLNGLLGRPASVSGATQIRAGVIRPEIVVPDPNLDPSQMGVGDQAEQNLVVGARIRLIREPYFGLLATVEQLPPEPVTIATGAKTRVLEARLDNGQVVQAPRANVEIVVS